VRQPIKKGALLRRDDSHQPATTLGRVCDQFQELAFQNINRVGKVVPAFEHLPRRAYHAPLALLGSKGGSFFDLIKGAFTGTTEHREANAVGTIIYSIVTLLARRLPPSIKGHDEIKFASFKPDFWRASRTKCYVIIKAHGPQ
jgi:hypothetical protein